LLHESLPIPEVTHGDEFVEKHLLSKTGALRALDVATGLYNLAITEMDDVDASKKGIVFTQWQTPEDQSPFAYYVDPFFLKLYIFIACDCGPEGHASLASFVACAIGSFQDTILGSDIRKATRIVFLKSFPKTIDYER
jgi:hypothetical protein